MAKIDYIAFDFVEENNGELSPNNVNVSIKSNENYVIARYKFNNSAASLFPSFATTFKYTYEDEVNGQITTRTIYGEQLPTTMKFFNSSQLLSVEYLNISNLTVLDEMFRGCANLTSLPCVVDMDVSHITSMARTFNNCPLLTELDLSNWNVGNVTNMSYLFHQCSALTSIGDISNWDMRKVVNAEYMFGYCTAMTYESLGDIKKWNISSMTTMNHMFYYCSGLTTLDLSGWNVSKATLMTRFVDSCFALSTFKINGWRLSSSVSASTFFNDCSQLKYIEMGQSTSVAVNKIIAQLPTRTANSKGVLNVENVDDISKVNTSTANSKHWNVIQYLIAQYKFNNTLYDLIPEFNEGFEYIYNDTVGDNVIAGVAWEYGSINTETGNFVETNNAKITDYIPINGNVVYLSNTAVNVIWYDSNKNYIGNDPWLNSSDSPEHLSPQNARYMKVWAGLADANVLTMTAQIITTRTIYGNELPTSIMFGDKANPTNRSNSLLEVNYLNTSNIVDMSYMFAFCEGLTLLNASHFDTNKVTNMFDIFTNCKSLTQIDVSTWDTSNVTNMYGLFQRCEQLTKIIGLNNFDTSSTINMSHMFAYCMRLKEIDISSFNMNKVTNMVNMLLKTDVLNSILMYDSDYNSVNKIISILPAKTADDSCVLNVAGVDDITQVNITTAQSKYWNIRDYIIKHMKAFIKSNKSRQRLIMTKKKVSSIIVPYKKY